MDEDQCDGANIYIEPPDSHVLTDEDSGEEDGGVVIDNLSGNQLLAPCTVTTTSFQHGRRLLNSEPDDDDEDDQRETGNRASIDLPSTSAGPPTKKTKSATERLFRKSDIPKKDLTFEGNSKSNWIEDKDYSPSTLFEMFFDDDVISLIKENTNLYASQCGKQTKVDDKDVKLTLAIIILSGYIPLPRRRMFWENAEDSRNEAVSSALSINRFEEILSCLHLADNDHLNTNDKMAKIRPLLSMLNERYLLFWPPTQNVNVDESMVPYYGRHSAKQFIRGKPIRWGFKMWCLNTPDGYLIQFEPYQGKGTVTMKPSLGMGGSVVMDLLSELPNLKFQVFMDNLFTSLPLMDELRLMGMHGTGTVRANRTQKCPLLSPEHMKKQLRGTMDHRLDKSSDTVIVRWNDNSVVTVMSTAYGIEPTQKAKRWSSEKKQHISIPMPDAVCKYNANMGGTDRMDQNISNYRPTIRIRKWWWPIFLFCVTSATQNAWLLYRKSLAAKRMPMDQMTFLRSLAMTYIMKYRQREPRPQAGLSGRPKSSNTRWPADVRFDGTGHYLTKAPDQRRCVQCHKNTTKMCSKCPRCYLHEKCFAAFHTE